MQEIIKGPEAEIESESVLKNAWTKIMTLADQYNGRCEFTALIRNEWTFQSGGCNLYRVGVFRDDQSTVDAVLSQSKRYVP